MRIAYCIFSFTHYAIRYTQYDYGKEAKQSLQTDVIYVVYVRRVYLPFYPEESDK